MQPATDNGVGPGTRMDRSARALLWAASPIQQCRRDCACQLPEHCVGLDAPGRDVEVRRRRNVELEPAC